jgi:hypothetical protein
VAQQFSRLSITDLIGAQLSVTPLTGDYLNELVEPPQSDFESLYPLVAATCRWRPHLASLGGRESGSIRCQQ